MTHNDNPLLDFSGLPRFADIRPEHVAPALETLLKEGEAALAAAEDAAHPADWLALQRTLDVPVERLSLAWGAVSHLNAVMDTPALRAAYNAALPQVTAFFTRLGASAALFAKYKAVDATTLNAAQQQSLRHTLRDFVLGGAELEGAARERFAAIQERGAELSQKFSENVLDATDRFAYYASAEEMDGVPPDVQQAAHAAAQADGKPGFKLTLHLPCYLPVMRFARSAALRERLYRAYSTRASDQAEGEGGCPGTGALDNTPVMRELLALRHEEAQLLGFANFGELSLAPKMASSPEQVLSFLRTLAARARPYAERDVREVREFAAEHLGMSELQPWDWAWASEKLREARYAFSEQTVKQYFQAPRVLDGLFRLAGQLFEVQIREEEEEGAASRWHPQVRFFRIERDGQLLGQFWLDAQARTGKRGGAWMDDVRARWLRPDSGALQTPVAHLVCNFAAGVDGKPPLLTHDEVMTLFHEFGHGLHHMLTQIDEPDVAGISGVEWDAVELPSQFMENFCWCWPVVQGMSAHVDTGEPLPRDLFDKMLAAKNFQAGMQTVRQIEFALFDMLLHTTPQQDVQALLDAVRREVAVVPTAPFARGAHTFSHIFAGGYAAGYYSYKWAEVLAADAYAAFEESVAPDGTPSLQTARKYRQEILEVGGSRPALDSFVAFRGREPSMDALLRHQGMAD